MASSDPTPLTPLQVDLLGCFSGVPDVYLTGGAALAHFYLQHRGSRDLDWFTPDREALPMLVARLRDHGARSGLRVEPVQQYPGFRRFEVLRPGDATVVDLVHEPVPQTVPASSKPLIDGVRVDSIEDIVANKLSALLGRSETKDLVDLYFLERAGHDPIAHLDAARARDGSVDPATLAWVLGSVPTDPSALLLRRTVSEDAIRAYRDDLTARLQALSHPGKKG